MRKRRKFMLYYQSTNRGKKIVKEGVNMRYICKSERKTRYSMTKSDF